MKLNDNKGFIYKVVAVAIAFFLVWSLSNRGSNSTSKAALNNYIIDYDKNNINIKDIQTSMSVSDEYSIDKKIDSVVNKHTYSFFKSLQIKFGKMSFEDHLKAVKSYFENNFGIEEAERLYKIYVKFTKYQNDLLEEMKNWPSPNNAEESIEYLRRLYNYQRKYFGKQIADLLFGADIKSKEYPIRRSAIISDKELYGKDKEDLIKKLNKDMWGEEASEIDSQGKSFVRYGEKLKIYDKDFQEMSSEEKTEKIKEFREEFFTPEIIERMESVDKNISVQKEIDEKYSTTKSDIDNDPNLTDKEREQKISDLQKEIYGNNADIIKRRENIKAGEKKILDKVTN